MKQNANTFINGYRGSQLYADIPVLIPSADSLSRSQILERLPELLIPWFEKEKRDLPWRHEISPYRVWISEIMLQQTRVEAVKPYYARFLSELPTIADLAAAEDDKLMKLWEGLGYYSRARNLKKAAVCCMERFDGEMPSSYEELLALPGIGSYTAGAIGSIAYHLPVPAVDGNVLRVVTRVLGDDTDISVPRFKTQIERELKEVLESSRNGEEMVDAGTFNSSLMELGATVCIPNGTPLCERCPLAMFCTARREGRCEELPVKSAKKPRRILNLDVFVIRCGEEVLIRKRPDSGMLAGLYEFPNATQEDHMLHSMLSAVSPTDRMSAKHVFTHVEWHMNGALYEVDRPTFLSVLHATEGAVPVSKEKIRSEAAIPGAFRYFLKLLSDQD